MSRGKWLSSGRHHGQPPGTFAFENSNSQTRPSLTRPSQTSSSSNIPLFGMVLTPVQENYHLASFGAFPCLVGDPHGRGPCSGPWPGLSERLASGARKSLSNGPRGLGCSAQRGTNPSALPPPLRPLLKCRLLWPFYSACLPPTLPYVPMSTSSFSRVSDIQ